MIIKSIYNAIRHRTAAVTKWEYRYKLYANRPPHNDYERNMLCFHEPILSEESLNKIGEEGWEIIRMDIEEKVTRIWFKRLKSD